MTLPKSLLLACAALALTACTHTPAPRYYLVSGPPLAGDAGTRSGPRIGLGPIKLPDYLDRPQIVTRASDTELDLSQAHRWAEPLSASFARALLAQLLAALPNDDVVPHPWSSSTAIARQVTLDVLRFDRGADGAFVLGARWTLVTPDAQAAVAPHLSEIRVPTGSQDYDALVAAANQAIAALAKEIATALATP